MWRPRGALSWVSMGGLSTSSPGIIDVLLINNYSIGVFLVYQCYLAWTQCNLMDMCRIINDNWCWMA